MNGRRRVPARWVSVLVACLVGGAPLAVTAPAHAATYRYWTYWTGTGASWAFSAQGPMRVPADGAVEGWRFAISTVAGSASVAPRAAADWDDLCQDEPSRDGYKRIGVVIDFGTPEDAPPGAHPPDGPVGGCAVVPLAATGYDALKAVAGTYRLDTGFVCGIAGYPATGCGEPVAAPSTSSPRPSQSDGSPGGGVTSGGATSGGATSGGAASPSPSAVPSGPRAAASATSDSDPAADVPEATSAPSALAANGPASTLAADASSRSPFLTVVAAVVAVALLVAATVWSRRRRT